MDGAGNRRDGEATTELERLGREGETVGGRALPEVPPDASVPSGDRIELWGRRIGRMLGWAAVVFLLFQLVRIYGQ